MIIHFSSSRGKTKTNFSSRISRDRDSCQGLPHTPLGTSKVTLEIFEVPFRILRQHLSLPSDNFIHFLLNVIYASSSSIISAQIRGPGQSLQTQSHFGVENSFTMSELKQFRNRVFSAKCFQDDADDKDV